MAAGALKDPNIGEFAQMAVFSLALAVTMIIFAFRENGTSTRFLGFTGGAVFLIVTGFFAFTTLSLIRPRAAKATHDS